MDVDTRQLMGVGGSVLLILGAFSPIVSVPLYGSANLFLNGQGDGKYIIGLGIVGVILAAFKRYSWLWLVIIPSALSIGNGFLNVQRSISQQEEGVPASAQMQWGWAVLLIALIIMVWAAVMREKKPITKKE